MNSKQNVVSAEHHYSTFTSDLQLQRLAVLQPDPISECSAVETMANSVSKSVSNFFRNLFYRVATACVPCYELATVLAAVTAGSGGGGGKKCNGEADSLVQPPSSAANNGGGDIHDDDDDDETSSGVRSVP